ncbi:hypothetical protein ACFQ3W_16270 [Paenibacillus puldeungensis]|uniref:Uncharacterized protein n=2 Tax=Paenibacillus puldeungensis TaxID=696536 RepID=A0ABW3RZA4_9BACL
MVSFEEVIKFLCVGGQIDGLRFGSVPQVLISNSEQNVLELKGQIYINLASRWSIFKSMPFEFPKNEEDIEDIKEYEELLMILEFRNKLIVNATVSIEASGLILEFSDGSVFYMHGYNEQYESWDIGVAFNPRCEHWQVISMPGGEIVGIIPDKYREKFVSNS